MRKEKISAYSPFAYKKTQNFPILRKWNKVVVGTWDIVYNKEKLSASKAEKGSDKTC